MQKPELNTLCGYLVDARCAETNDCLTRRIFEDYASATLLAERLEKEYLREGRAAVIGVFRLTCSDTLIERRRTVGVRLPAMRVRKPRCVRKVASVEAAIDRLEINLWRQVDSETMRRIAGTAGVRSDTLYAMLWRIRRRRGIRVRRQTAGAPR